MPETNLARLFSDGVSNIETKRCAFAQKSRIIVTLQPRALAAILLWELVSRKHRIAMLLLGFYHTVL